MSLPEAAYQSPETVVHEEIDGEVVVLDTRTYKTFLLNKSAALIWGLLQKRYTVACIIGVIAPLVSAGAHDLPAQVASFIDQLANEGLVTQSHAAGICQAPPLHMASTGWSVPSFQIFDDAYAETIIFEF